MLIRRTAEAVVVMSASSLGISPTPSTYATASWKGSSAALATEFHATRHSARRAAFAPARSSFRTGRLLGRAAIQLSTACSGAKAVHQPRGDSEE
jgi:hypothetical protein